MMGAAVLPRPEERKSRSHGLCGFTCDVLIVQGKQERRSTPT